MKSFNLLNAFFLSNPLYRGMAEKIILVGTGICGLLFSWKTFPIFPSSHMSGGILILLAYGFHWWVHKVHKQAHEESQEIETIVTAGAFSKIRHPLYLSTIAMNIGISVAFGIMVTFYPNSADNYSLGLNRTKEGRGVNETISSRICEI
jgi:hypothetical protein